MKDETHAHRAIARLNRLQPRGDRFVKSWLDAWKDNYEHLMSTSKDMLLPGHASLSSVWDVSTSMAVNIYATMLGNVTDLCGSDPNDTPTVHLWLDVDGTTSDPGYIEVPRKVAAAAKTLVASTITYDAGGGVSIPEGNVEREWDDKDAGIVSVKLKNIAKGTYPKGKYSGTIEIKDGRVAAIATIDVKVTVQ
ncbi:MAG: hypothetical protein ACLP1X_05355 [Polyangiaceae bacterium]